jgi:ABC-type Mn2+/Zn2+ transport system permease subunit
MSWLNQFGQMIAEPWQFAFMQRGMLAVILVGLCCATLGTHIVLRRLSFIGDGLAHATFGGLAVGFLAKANLFFSAAAAALLTAIGIGTVSRKADISMDTAIGILFSGMFAAGVMILSHDRGYRGDLFDLLLGNVLTVGPADLQMTLAATGLVAFCLLVFYKELLFTSFDPAGAAACGIPVVWLDYGLLALVAITVTTALQTVGVILVSALLVTPAASAIQLTNRFPIMMALSAAFGVIAGLVGIYISYYMDVPAGAAVVLVATALFFISLCVSPKRGAVKVPETSEEPAGQSALGHFHKIR